MEAGTELVDQGTYDPAQYAEELEAAPHNLDVGTSILFENHRIRVWDIILKPGERGPFHAHTRNYFWTVVEGSRGLQRFADGTFAVRDYLEGETKWLEHTPETALIHDLENIGDTDLRFVTVELFD
ncbi:MAG: cupin domain-containing protein [Acidimicrobiia bacterium]